MGDQTIPTSDLRFWKKKYLHLRTADGTFLFHIAHPYVMYGNCFAPLYTMVSENSALEYGN